MKVLCGILSTVYKSSKNEAPDKLSKWTFERKRYWSIFYIILKALSKVHGSCWKNYSLNFTGLCIRRLMVTYDEENLLIPVDSFPTPLLDSQLLRTSPFWNQDIALGVLTRKEWGLLALGQYKHNFGVKDCADEDDLSVFIEAKTYIKG